MLEPLPPPPLSWGRGHRPLNNPVFADWTRPCIESSLRLASLTSQRLTKRHRRIEGEGAYEAWEYPLILVSKHISELKQNAPCCEVSSPTAVTPLTVD